MHHREISINVVELHGTGCLEPPASESDLASWAAEIRGDNGGHFIQATTARALLVRGVTATATATAAAAAAAAARCRLRGGICQGTDEQKVGGC